MIETPIYVFMHARHAHAEPRFKAFTIKELKTTLRDEWGYDVDNCNDIDEINDCLADEYESDDRIMEI